MIKRFPIYKAGHIFNKYEGKISSNYSLKYNKVIINYPCRLDAMAIDPSAVCYNEEMVFTPGEVVISVNKKIKVTINVINDSGGKILISNSTKRKVLVKHAYYLITDVLKINPSLEIDVDDNDIPKHCGFGSSSSTITAVVSAINELYGCPLPKEDLIKYLTSNHGEEVSDDDEDNLKSVQSIGGGAKNGLIEEGIFIIAGRATTIAKIKYESNVLIGIPKDFIQKNADELMKLEEDNLWKFEITGKKYAKEIAYNLLHKALPDMINGNLESLAKVVFDYRFDMGSIDNCSFVYNKINEIAENIRELYENKNCEFLALSSVGPAFFALTKDDHQHKICKQKMHELNMEVIETTICNNVYECELFENKTEDCSYWEQEDTVKAFTDRPPSKYITNVIDSLINKKQNSKILDIGCGGGRYSRYVSKFSSEIYSIDKYKKMIDSPENKMLNFLTAKMDNIPFKDNMFDFIFSIGVIHNATSIEEYKKSIIEIYRLLSKDGYAIISLFTNDLITDDLTEVDNYIYTITDREPMVLLSKTMLKEILVENNLKIIKILDEHITNVGSGERNVYSLLVQK
ncbi:MAG: methyltransferase domain-containing protein [Bacilli bacterium]|nr:methyltransferase domain-containing protein [Bacilli bacterium]